MRVQLPIMLPGLGHVNCYVLEDARGITLIDPGLPGPDAHQELASRLKRAGYPIEAVHTVLVTHSHPDHFGGAGRLKVEQHCEVVAHEHFSTPFDRAEQEHAAAALLDGDIDELVDVATEEPSRATTLREVLFGDGEIPDVPARLTPWGGEGFRPSAEEIGFIRSWDRLSKEGLLSLDPTVRVRDEQIIVVGGREWIVVHTPGHTGDHVCLFDPEHGTLLSGDHVLPTITPHITGMTGEPDLLAQFFAALRRVAAIDGVTTVLPAHGQPFEDLTGRVDEIIEHHHERLDLLYGIAVELEDGDVRSYSQRLFRERSWGPMAESETYAHLEHLRLAGRLGAERRDGQLRYSPAGTGREGTNNPE